MMINIKPDLVSFYAQENYIGRDRRAWYMTQHAKRKSRVGRREYDKLVFEYIYGDKARKYWQAVHKSNARTISARIKLKQADLTCPLTLLRVLSLVVTDLEQLPGPPTYSDGKITFAGIPWSEIAARIRTYTGTRTLPRGMSDIVKRAFVHVARIAAYRARDRRNSTALNAQEPRTREEQLTCLDMHLTRAYIRTLGGHHPAHRARPIEIRVSGGNERTEVVGRTIVLGRSRVMTLRKRIPKMYVKTVYGDKCLVTQAKRWCGFSELLQVEYLDWSGELVKGWARPTEADPKEYELASILETAREIESVTSRFGPVHIDNKWLY